MKGSALCLGCSTVLLFPSAVRRVLVEAEGFLLVFDVTRKETFVGAEHWANEIFHYSEAEPAIVVVGNKSDLEEVREVSFEEGASLAERFKARYIETSAKMVTNVHEAFQTLAEDIVDKYPVAGPGNGINTRTAEIDVLVGPGDGGERPGPDQKPNKRTCAIL